MRVKRTWNRKLAVVWAILVAGCGGGGSTTPPPPVSPPVAAGDSAVARDGTPVTIDVLANDSDPGLASLSVISVSNPARGTAAISAGKVLYTPGSAGFMGADSFTYVVSNGVKEATGSVQVKGVQALVLHGKVYDGPIANAAVSVATGGQTFTATADGSGNYALTVDVSDPTAVLTVDAKGAAGQPQVALATVLGSYGFLQPVGAAPLHDLAAAADPKLNVTNVSTARCALLTEANAGLPPATDAQIVQAEKAIDTTTLLDVAAAIKVAVDQAATFALPAGCPDTLALATSQDHLTTFVASVVAAAGSTAPLDAARAATVADPLLTPILVPASGKKAYEQVASARTGYLSRFGWVIELDAATHQGRVIKTDGIAPFTWADDAGTLVITASAPIWSYSSWESIRDSPAPLAVQDAFVAARGGPGLWVQMDCLSMRLRPVTQGALVTWADETDHVRLTWAFTLASVSYSYESQLDGASTGTELREQAAAPVIPWTPDLATGTWALDVYYSAGIDFTSQTAEPPMFNGEVLTLAAGGTGSSRFTGRTLTWIIADGLLNLAFSDGSSQSVRILDQSGLIYGLWSEHRDSSGTPVAGTYDYGFHRPSPLAGTTDLFTTSATDFWVSAINHWQSARWVGSEPVWNAYFGWQLRASGSGSNFQTVLGADGNYGDLFGPPLVAWANTPDFAWSVDAEGQARIDRIAFATGENKSYRLIFPVDVSADGNRLYAIEQELRRSTKTGSYRVWIAPRLTFYERWKVPALGGACNVLVNAAPAVADAQVALDAPAAAGGTIADGTYYLTSATGYAGAAGPAVSLGNTIHEVLVVSGATAQVVYSDTRNAEVRATFSLALDAAGHQITFTPTCGGGAGQPPSTLYFTATPTELKLTSLELYSETVFTKQ